MYGLRFLAVVVLSEISVKDGSGLGVEEVWLYCSLSSEVCFSDLFELGWDFVLGIVQTVLSSSPPTMESIEKPIFGFWARGKSVEEGGKGIILFFDRVMNDTSKHCSNF